MNRLTNEQADALHASGDRLEVVDPSTNRVYVIVDQETLRKAQSALEHHQAVESIRLGVADMEAGREMTLEESKRRTEEAIRQHSTQ